MSPAFEKCRHCGASFTIPALQQGPPPLGATPATAGPVAGEPGFIRGTTGAAKVLQAAYLSVAPLGAVGMFFASVASGSGALVVASILGVFVCVLGWLTVQVMVGLVRVHMDLARSLRVLRGATVA